MPPSDPDFDALTSSINLRRLTLPSGEAESPAVEVATARGPTAPAAIERLLVEASRRLAVYGSLAPGEINHHELAPLTGAWIDGTVRGHLRAQGWGAAHGFPGLQLDSSAAPVRVRVFTSADLPDHWPRLDVFEGDEYVRLLVRVETAEGAVLCNVYTIRPPQAA